MNWRQSAIFPALKKKYIYKLKIPRLINRGIFITHNIQEAISLGNKIMVMSKNGTIKEKMDNPISKPVTPASEGYGELWEHLNNALTEENKDK